MMKYPVCRLSSKFTHMRDNSPAMIKYEDHVTPLQVVWDNVEFGDFQQQPASTLHVEEDRKFVRNR